MKNVKSKIGGEFRALRIGDRGLRIGEKRCRAPSGGHQHSKTPARLPGREARSPVCSK
jgi:hypothetical protein